MENASERPTSSPPAMLDRRVARVLLIDATSAVLLLSARDPVSPASPEFWYTPGGGAEAGEALEDAARREVYEETGRLVGDLGPVLWRRSTSFSFDGVECRQDESYFVVRTARFDLQSAGWTELERRSTTGWRWWAIDELVATQAILFPPRLGVLLAELEREGRPANPVTID